MLCRDAIACAADWLRDLGCNAPGYAGAYLSGSILECSRDAEWPEDSDVDIVILCAGDELPASGKFHHGGALIEATYMRADELADAGHVLATHYLAYALYHGAILGDPRGLLLPLHGYVSAEYAKPDRVRLRWRGMIGEIRGNIAAYNPAAPLHERAMGWLFSTGKTAFPILLAAGKNCTVRKRYCAARAALSDLGLSEMMPALMRPLIGNEFDAASLPVHIAALGEAFDDACVSCGASANYRFRSDISPGAKSLSVGWCENMLTGAHPEDCVFWLGATFARCLTILHMDGNPAYARHLDAFCGFLAALGILKGEDIDARIAALPAFLDEVEQMAERVLIQLSVG